MSIRVETITALDCRLLPAAWPFAAENRAAIMTHWRELAAAKPHLWNGDVLICTAAEVRDRILTARFATTDYASFLAWRDWGFPDPSARNCFGVPAAITTDRALIFGVMAATTLNAGKSYPPSGSLEPRDVTAAGEVDIRASIRVEFGEETGLDYAKGRPGEVIAVFEGRRLAVVETLWLPHDFATVETVFASHQASESSPELARLEAIRGSSEIDSRMPIYAQEIVRRFEMAGHIG